MVINAAGLVIDLDLKHLTSFKNIDAYKTFEKPNYFLKTVNEFPSFSKKEEIESTIYYKKYRTNLGILQQQYAADKWIGSILYNKNQAFIYLNYDFFEIEYLLSQYAFVYWIKQYTDSLFVHGSSINYQHNGILFCAKSGVGKSTQRRLWEMYGKAVCINDDKNVLCLNEKNISILPNPWSGKHFVNSNQTVFLKTIIFLRRGKENRVSKISASDAFPLLLAQMDLPDYDGKDKWGKIMDQLLELPLFLYECNMDADAFYVLESKLSDGGVFK